MTGMEDNQHSPWLGSPAILAPLHHHILPRLTALDTSRLACTCKNLRAAVACAPPSAWTAAVADCLPQTVCCSTWTDAQALLNRYVTAKRNVRSNCGHAIAQLTDRQRRLCEPVFSQDGSKLCWAVIPSPQQCTAFDLNGESLWSLITVQWVHTGETLCLPVRGHLSSCVFSVDGQSLVLAAVSLEELDSTRGSDLVGREACLELQVHKAAIKEGGLGLKSSIQRFALQDCQGTEILKTSLAPGGTFLSLICQPRMASALRNLLVIDLSRQEILLQASVSAAMAIAEEAPWSADGCKLAVIRQKSEHGTDTLQALNLVRGLRVNLLADKQPRIWERVMWRGEVLVASLPNRVLMMFRNPFSAPHVAVHLQCRPTAFLSPCCTLAVQGPAAGGWLGQHAHHSVLVRLSNAQQLCALTKPRSWGHPPASCCYWSPDSLFLAVKNMPRGTVASACTFYDASTGAVVLQEFCSGGVCDLLWAPDCCSIVIIGAVASDHWDLFLVRFAPAEKLNLQSIPTQQYSS